MDSLKLLVRKLYPYLDSKEVELEAERIRALLSVLPSKLRKIYLKKAIKMAKEQKGVGEFAPMLLSAFLGSLIGNTFGYLVRMKFSEWLKKRGLIR